MISNTPHLVRSRLLVAGALLCALLAGCAADVTSRTETTGTFIGRQTLAQITPGKSPEFVTALIGQPTEKNKVDDTDEIWKWVYTEKHISNGNAFLMTGTASDTQRTHTTFVEFKNGEVAKAWAD